MEYSYYNKIKFEKACLMIKLDPVMAKDYFEEYLNLYPRDYNAYTWYAYVLIVLNKFEDAKKVLDYVESISILNKNFLKLDKKVKILNDDILLDKIRIMAGEGKYEELYSQINGIKEVANHELNSLLVFCKKKLGLLDSEECHNYICKQIFEYDRNAFLDHIKKHLTSDESDSLNNAVFGFEFPINKILEEIEKYIPSSSNYFNTTISDSYYFKYNDCGRCNGKIVDNFKVVCLRNTGNIITMFPSNYIGDLFCADLNYINEENNKAKRLSQIEKFNRKFKRN